MRFSRVWASDIFEGVLNHINWVIIDAGIETQPARILGFTHHVVLNLPDSIEITQIMGNSLAVVLLSGSNEILVSSLVINSENDSASQPSRIPPFLQHLLSGNDMNSF